ncbi:MAG TPA: glycosyltransferase [Usitatibacter sp.]|nr:glycosyltransferase [Usitatibacter sp.]
MTTFVTLGNMNQPFPRLLAGVEALAAELPRPIVAQRGNTPYASQVLELVDFLPPERFAELVRTARVLVMHAGAGSIIHALQAGRTPVVMPRSAALGEAIDDHQAELADAFAREARLFVAHDARGLAAAVRSALEARPAAAREPAAMLGLVDAAIRARLAHARG